MSAGSRSPDLAVIIPAHNEEGCLGGCLDSVHRALECAGVTAAEVVVVDDASADQTSAVATAHGALAIRQGRRQGPLEAWSLGVASTSAALLFFVDADCRVDQGAFAALLPGFAQPTVGIVAARSQPDGGRAVDSLVERSATFSALMLHEVKTRLVNHDFLPIGRLMAVRRAAWQDGDHRWPCDRVIASRAKRAGWEIRYAPDALVYYEPVGTYRQLRSDYVRTAVAQAHLNRGWSDPLPRRVASRAAWVSLRRQPVNAAAWLTLRTRLWAERAAGLMPPDEGYARWDRIPPGQASARRPRPGQQTPEEPAGRPA